MMLPRRRRACSVLVAVLGTVTFIHSLRLYLICPATPSNVALKQSDINVIKKMVSKEHKDPNSNNSKFWNPEKILRKGHERLPFPAENTGYLPTAHFTAQTCKEKPKYLFFVYSVPGNFHHRLIMRGTLQNKDFSKKYQWTTVFFVGLSADKVTEKRVEEEASQHGDVVVLPFKDDQRNLTYKFVYGMKWMIENCPSVQYIVKTTDDFAINVIKVMDYLNTLSKSRVKQFHCLVVTNGYVIRNITSRWYLSEKMYPNKIFPPYCSGSAIMFNAGALRDIYNATFFVPFHAIDDVYVTGEAALIAGVELIEVNNLCSLGGSDVTGVTSGNVMFSKINDNQLRDSAWKNILESLQKKDTETSGEGRDLEWYLEHMPPWLRRRYERRLGDLGEEELRRLFERRMRDYYDEDDLPPFLFPGRRGRGRERGRHGYPYPW